MGTQLHSANVRRHTKAVKKRGLSIRYKILLLLTTIPLIMLSVYLFLALQIFEKDKVAYVFDSSSNVSGAMASQIKTQLNSILITTKPIFQDYLNQRSFLSLAQSVFSNDPSLEAVVAFTPDSTGLYKASAELKKNEQSVSDIMTALGTKFQSYIVETYATGRIVKAPFTDNRVLIFEKVGSGANITIFMVALRMNEIADSFKMSTAQKLYLTSADGVILFGPDESSGKSLRNFFDISFLKSDSKVAQGAETTKDNRGTELLVSFSRAGFADLYIVSAVSKAKALIAMQVLIRKSLIFFVILVCITAIISLFASSSLTAALTSLFDATGKISEGDFNIRVKVASNDEVGALAENFNTMAAEVSRLLEQSAEKARMQSELQTAKMVQETLFPEPQIKIGPLEITGFYEPASECGGDWWHYCRIGNKIFLWIGDATGHGASAALITSAAKSAATIIEELDVGPSKAMELLNMSVYDVSKGRIMMTFFLGALDLQTGVLTYCNASHEAPFLMPQGIEAFKKKDLIPLNEVINPRLGQARDTKYEEISVQLKAGDGVFFYTDGIPDIQNTKKETWGEREFLKNLVMACKDRPTASASVERFVSSFQEYRQGASLIDDVTFFMVKYDGEVTNG